VINDVIKLNEPYADFKTEDDVTHIVWVIDSPAIIAELQALFSDVDALYIADGHHRSASSVNVALERRKEFPDAPKDAEFNYFMAVIFPDEDLYIMDYNRIVSDLNGMTTNMFLEKLSALFHVEKTHQAFHPHKKGTMCMYLDGNWYSVESPPSLFEGLELVERLDVSVLQDRVLAPLLGIDDPRTNPRIDFVGGIRGLGELKRRVDEEGGVAFAMCPPTIDDLFNIADAGMVMPPKSTWFEPKLRSGLFVHLLSD
jgi:uncharacterized protein (DUF1015 family)